MVPPKIILLTRAHVPTAIKSLVHSHGVMNLECLGLFHGDKVFGVRVNPLDTQVLNIQSYFY